MDGDSSQWRMYLIMEDKVLEVPEPVNYDAVCEEPKYKTVPNKILETWAEKACRYDRIANSILKEDYKITDIHSEDYDIEEPIADLIWHMVEYVLDGLHIYGLPYAEDYLDHYLIKD